MFRAPWELASQWSSRRACARTRCRPLKALPCHSRSPYSAGRERLRCGQQLHAERGPRRERAAMGTPLGLVSEGAQFTLCAGAGAGADSSIDPHGAQPRSRSSARLSRDGSRVASQDLCRRRRGFVNGFVIAWRKDRLCRSSGAHFEPIEVPHARDGRRRCRHGRRCRRCRRARTVVDEPRERSASFGRARLVELGWSRASLAVARGGGIGFGRHGERAGLLRGCGRGHGPTAGGCPGAASRENWGSARRWWSGHGVGGRGDGRRGEERGAGPAGLGQGHRRGDRGRWGRRSRDR